MVAIAPTDTEIIVIGSGIGGLTCAAMLARYGFDVVVCESHSIAGGAAHGFERDGFTFDSGPSLYSGLSYSPSAIRCGKFWMLIGEKLPCITYDTWGCCLPEGDFDTSVGASQFAEVLARLRGAEAVAEWRQLQRIMEPYAKAATALPSLALRFDLGAVFTLGQFAPAFLQTAGDAIALAGPFSKIWTKMSKIRLSEIG
jgi:Phytoene dehydrogenase and related proteins